jgi:hypothetical protein
MLPVVTHVNMPAAWAGTAAIKAEVTTIIRVRIR